MAYGETYEEFVEKFKPKKTTDDCYTPPIVYECVADWVVEKYGRDRSLFVRPFYPGGDYEHYDYPDGCTVVDNPPFSLYSKIVQFYTERDIKFFIFAPSLTCISAATVTNSACGIPCDVSIVYENGAEVNTGFCTNLETDFVLKSEPELYSRLYEADKQNRKDIKKQVPKYRYPDHVVTAAVQLYSRWGVPFAVKREDCVRIRELDAQKSKRKTIFGGGLLLSDKAAQAKARADKEAREKARAEKERIETEKTGKAHVWELSEREYAIIEEINNRGA